MLPPTHAKYIDDLMRADLLCWRDLWFGWLLLSTKLVVVGLILEGPELIHELISVRGRVRIEKSGASLQESHTSDWVKIVALLGWLLIVGGVAGEWITDAVISDADGSIQAFNNVLLAETTKEAGDARQKAGEANERAALANERAGKGSKARTAMLLQLQPRDFTKKQMDDFGASIKGKVTDLNVFTLPDPEALAYGFKVMEGLQRAQVKVDWYPMHSSYFLISGIDSSGLTTYESPGRKEGISLMEAFMNAGQDASRLIPERPTDLDKPGLISLSSVPRPALFIGLKQPAFTWLPRYRNSPALHAHRPPWDPK
jgi:hypothetical protein